MALVAASVTALPIISLPLLLLVVVVVLLLVVVLLGTSSPSLHCCGCAEEDDDDDGSFESTFVVALSSSLEVGEEVDFEPLPLPGITTEDKNPLAAEYSVFNSFAELCNVFCIFFRATSSR